MLNTFFAVIALLFGVLLSLVAYRILPLERWLNPGEVADWHDRFGRIFKIAGPVVALIGALLLLF